MLRSAARLTGIAVVIGLGAVYFAGCGSNIESACDDVCDCAGCSESEKAQCIDELEDAEVEADDVGCGSEFRNAMSCYADKVRCEDGDTPVVEGCETEIAALAECGGTVLVGDCTSLCNRSKQCEGSDPSVDCEASCEASEAQADSAGCLPEFNAVLACIAAEPDICTINGCSEELNAYGACFES